MIDATAETGRDVVRIKTIAAVLRWRWTALGRLLVKSWIRRIRAFGQHRLTETIGNSDAAPPATGQNQGRAPAVTQNRLCENPAP